MRIKRSIIALSAFLLFTAPVLAANDGYEGLIAPSQPDSPPSRDEPSPSGPVSYSATPVPDAKPDMTPTADYQPPFEAKTEADLGLAAKIYDVQNDKGPLIELTPDELASLSEPEKVNGMSSSEYMVEEMLKAHLEDIGNTSNTPAQRAEKMKAARESLEQLAMGLRNKSDVPDSAFIEMGASKAYVDEKKRGAAQALTRLESALKELPR